MTMTCMIIRTIFIGLGVIALSGCDWVGMFAKEAVIGATSHRGWDSFTFTGQLPANFGIDAIAFYGPDNPRAVNCQGPTFETGKTVTRSYIKKYTADIQAQPQAFSFEIPLSYYKGLCGMKLGRVKLEINARYGSNDWQRAYGRGNLFIARDASARTSVFDKRGLIELTGACMWLFQQSVARSFYGEIEKSLKCRGAGAELLMGEVANKTINLKVTVDSEEKPSEDETWIKFPGGWKPCAEKNGWRWCREPVEFKTFKMNGQTCTVYPGCTE